MKRVLGASVGLVTILTLIGVRAPAALAYATGTSFPLITVDNGSGDQSQPHVSGHYASYDVAPTISSDVIGYHDFATQGNGAVPQTSDDVDALSDISGNTIVFTRTLLSDGRNAIYSYPVGGTATEVAPMTPPALPNRSNPAIGGSTIAWEDVGVSATGDPELVLTTGSGTTQLTNDAAVDQNPNLSSDGTAIAWEKCSAPGACDIYVAKKSGASWATTAVATSSANETSADTNGSQVVYASNAGGSSHVYVATIGSSASQVPAITLSENHPAIAGGFVAFEGSDGTQTDIYVYYLGASTLYRITNTPQESEFSPDISLSTTAGVSTATIVWEVNEGATGYNVYASQFTAVSPPSFTDHLLQPMDETTDPANPMINTGKNGRVIPVKVQISQGGTAITDQNAPGPVTIGVSHMSSCASGATVDSIETYADAGQSSAGTNQFVYDATTQAWAYNLDTKALGLVTGNCYRIGVSVDGTAIASPFAILKPTK